jgi:ribonuclease Z
MGKKVFAIDNIFLTHGHEDHVAGISNLINIRNITSGEFYKPLTIYYPRNDKWINDLFEYIEKKQSGLLRYPLYVQPLEPGDEVEVKVSKRPTKVRAFEMVHAPSQLCLGYEILEERKVQDRITGEGVMTHHPIFFYTGDGYEPRNYIAHGRIDIAVYEATFLAMDVGENARSVSNRHSTVENTIKWAASQDVKRLVMCHISDRYSLEEVIPAALKAKKEAMFRGELYIANCSDIIPVEVNKNG